MHKIDPHYVEEVAVRMRIQEADAAADAAERRADTLRRIDAHMLRSRFQPKPRFTLPSGRTIQEFLREEWANVLLGMAWVAFLLVVASVVSVGPV